MHQSTAVPHVPTWKDTYLQNQREKSRDMAGRPNRHERFMEGLEVRRLELLVTEAKGVLHDDIARERGEEVRHVQRLWTPLELGDPLAQ
jgi:hypothetical protein